MLEITVLKNLNKPSFSPLPPYYTKVNDFDPVGTPIFDVNATDADKTVSNVVFYIY